MSTSREQGDVPEKALVDWRRVQVARLVARGYTQREIVEGLQKLGLTNEQTGEPWSLGTVNSDVQAVRRQWRRSALLDMAEERGKALAEIEEARRAAWLGDDPRTVLAAIKQKCELLGLEEPLRFIDETEDRKGDALAHRLDELAARICGSVDGDAASGSTEQGVGEPSTGG